MNIDEVELTRGELNIATAPEGWVLKRTSGGASILFYERTSQPPAVTGAYAIPVAEQHVDELITGGASGYTRSDIPFVLDIRLVN